MPMTFCDRHEILHKCHKMPIENMTVHTANGDTKVHCWIPIPLHIKQVTIKLPLKVCDTKVKAGFLFGKDATDKLDCWQE